MVTRQMVLWCCRARCRVTLRSNNQAIAKSNWRVAVVARAADAC